MQFPKRSIFSVLHTGYWRQAMHIKPPCKKHLKIYVANQALSPVSKTNWICRCTGYLTRRRDNVCVIPLLTTSSHSSQHTGLTLHIRMREKKELYKLCQITLIHRKRHKLILSFLRLKARYLRVSILEALISFLNSETFINLGH